MGELANLARAYRTWRGLGQDVALAQVTGARGSVYRKTGTKMLLTPSGDMQGTVSGGCLEPELVEVARTVLESGEPKTETYDLAEDTMWGLGIGCAGTVEVHVAPVSDALCDAWEATDTRLERWAVVEALDGRGRLIVEDGPQGAVRAEGEFDASPDVRADALARVRARLASDPPQGGRETLGNGREVFVDVLVPPPLLVVLGAGHDAVPVCQLASMAGFRLRVVDPRPAYATPRRLSGAEILSNDLAAAYAGREAFDVDHVFEQGSYAVVLHHHLARDRAALAFLSQSKARYAGILGPRSRTLGMLQEIRAEGRLGPAFGEDGEGGILASPIGLDLGAEGPEQIAVAIVAEIVALRSGRAGGRLAGWSGPIHATRGR